MKRDHFKFAQLHAVHVLLPLMVGGSIYICYRGTSLRMFAWYDVAGLHECVQLARSMAAPFRSTLPDWTVYSLPNGLWVYSLTAFMLLVWQRQGASRIGLAWPHLGIVLGLGSEALQLAGVLSGTFDSVDSWLCITFYLLAFVLLRGPAKIITGFNQSRKTVEVTK